jgi:serine/threonine-protein phosphatase 5
MGIMKPRLALKDFKTLAAREPGNKDAQLKLSECEKIVRRIQFEKAIESDAPPSSFEGISPDDLGTPRNPLYSPISLLRGSGSTDDWL